MKNTKGNRRVKGMVSEEMAEEIINPVYFFRPKHIEEAWGIEIPRRLVPPIRFTQKEVEQASILNQSLILNVRRIGGRLATMKAMRDKLENKLGKYPDGRDGKLLFNTDWCDGEIKEPFFSRESLFLEWRLEGRDFIPGTVGVNYLVQTEAIAKYVRSRLYPDGNVPTVYKGALKEFDDKRGQINDLMESDPTKAAKMLASLQINQYFRPSAGNFLFHNATHTKINRGHLYHNNWVWTKSRSSFGDLVYLGHCDPGGVGVVADVPGRSYSGLGVCLSRSVSSTLVT